ncbi:MAG: MFS transporter [Opitutales bacterium]
MPVAPSISGPSAAPRLGRYRWGILALIFFATTINYMDRTVLTVLAPVLQYKVFHWTDNDYARITMAFQAAYAVGLVIMGAVIDRLGTRVGYTISILVWCGFDLLHAAVRPAFGLIGFSLARFGFGFGQAGTYPAAIKTVAEWFPRTERALAMGIFNAGSNMGAILAPLLVPLLVSAQTGAHWQYVFLAMGLGSATCAVLWWRIYRPPENMPGLSAAELAHINRDCSEETGGKRPVRWRQLLPLRETWAYAVAKCTDAAWWFYSFWTGKFFFDQFGLDLKTLALPLIVIFVTADFGSIGGGWLSSHFLKRGWSVNRARKVTMLICALCALPVALSTRLGTRFKVTAATLATLQAAPDSGGVVQQLQVLEGKSYGSAKEFLGEIERIIGRAETTRLEGALITAARSDSLYWVAVGLIALAAAGHQAWSATIFTMVPDLFPKVAVASVVGIGGMIGSLAGVTTSYWLGHALTASGPAGYSLMFLAVGISYLLMLGFVHLLIPRWEPVDLSLD